MILALISIACFSDISNSLQAMLICARISNAIGTDACLRDVHCDDFCATDVFGVSLFMVGLILSDC